MPGVAGAAARHGPILRWSSSLAGHVAVGYVDDARSIMSTCTCSDRRNSLNLSWLSPQRHEEMSDPAGCFLNAQF